MTSANVDLVRSIFAAWDRGDFRSAEWAHPEIELAIADGPAPDSWKGLPGLVEGIRSILSAWQEWRVESDEFRELDDERVLVLAHLSGRGRTSGLELGQMHTAGASVMQIHDGKVTQMVLYWDHEHALADLGLTE
jgi:ketosteroid isomerase-like protein